MQISNLRFSSLTSGSQKSQEASLAERGAQAHTFLFFNVFIFCQKFLGDLVGWELLSMAEHHASTISLPSSLPSEEMLVEVCLHLWNRDKKKPSFFISLRVFVILDSTKVCWNQRKGNKQTLSFILHQKSSKSIC